MRWLMLLIAVAGAGEHSGHRFYTVEERLAILNRATVWEPRDIPSADVAAGPDEPGAFAPDAVVSCDFAGRPGSGRSPKFTCALSPHDRVKVKFGQTNGEVYAEVAATRLLWLLGFYADRMYPVRVLCRHCPQKLGGTATSDPDVSEFAIAAIERPFAGAEIDLRHRRGWEWGELDIAKGSSRRERDALKLAAVLMQHTDSKSEQQRLLCPDAACERPVAMITDLGMTFGRASLYNNNSPSSVNLGAWARTPVWAGPSGCTGNITKSSTGSLDRPQISEAGRAFLAERLRQVSDRQLRDLFTVARFDKRHGDSIDAWIAAFRAKCREIETRRCDN
jgi:hypothetical protein